ncbi:cysteine protease StiP family protein [Massilia yuzhufengensis]|uniref:PELOTA RNA binding domain-containing protein n=1 Tax=Massilia yuzhufengensis TaxID=1164594 RepID=A0A1I1W533_9BURK|nr:cysteine protease StiP family protein [Massilia yuzhufengensis]SFD90234.1 PELOTA RNA binding domain-containing protein [Massilia yuzhufengensis]
MSFSGSYRSEDVRFLLTPLQAREFTSVVEKERLIQSGQRHYSQMLSPESAPSTRYMAVFDEACRANNARMAADCLQLAALIAARRSGAITLVSLARAGTPVGVVVARLLRERFGREAVHYSVSIVRDRGIDRAALRHILAQGHAAESIVFVDGWTGKGAIARELALSVSAFNATEGCAIDNGLHVLSDLAGAAACAASGEDYLIPSSILNATVSGLVSRTVLDERIGPDDFHGCVYYAELAPHDQSQRFADALVELAIRAAPAFAAPLDAKGAAQRSRAYLAGAMARYGVADVNLIKPGIGEATRVLLRRVPRLLVLRQPGAPDVAHLEVLAEEKQVPVEIDPDLPYHAVSLIRSASDG